MTVSIQGACNSAVAAYLISLFKKLVLDHENTLFAEVCRKNSLNRTLRIEISLDYPSLLWLAAPEYPKKNFAFLARLSTLTILTEPIQCSKSLVDPHVHCFCECSAFNSNRELFWQRIEDECPISLYIVIVCSTMEYG
jgi:hypothetical protein